MRKSLILLSALAVLFSGCRDNSGIRSYWASHNVDVESDFKTAESQFTDFVELASAAPEADAFAAIDMLLAKARKNEVAYLVYTEWIYRGFSSILSPCRSCPIFIHAADKILSHGILRDELAQQYDRRRAFCRYNRAGDTAVIPVSGCGPGLPVLQRINGTHRIVGQARYISCGSLLRTRSASLGPGLGLFQA